MKKKLIAILTILSLTLLIPSTAFASLVGAGPSDEYGIPIGAVGLSLSGENAVDANQDYVNFVNYLDESCEANGTCFQGGVGIVLQVFKYSGGNEEPIGHPIYIINDSLLVDLTTNNGVATPSSYSAFVSKNWGFPQALAPEINNTDSWLIYEEEPKGEDGNPNLDTKDYTMMGPDGTPLEGQELTFENRRSCQYDMSHCKPVRSASGIADYSSIDIGHKTGHVHQIFKYSTGYKRTSYPRSKIKNMPSSYIDDPNLTEDSVASGYLNTHIEKQYVYVSINKINELYGTSLTDKDIGKYYIEMQGVYRHLLPPVYVGPFLIRTLQNEAEEEEELTDSDVTEYKITPDNENECPTGYWSSDKIKDATSAYCSRNNNYPTVPITCSVSGNSCNNTSLCTYHSAQPAQYGDPYCHTTVTRYKYSSESCGWMNYHQLFGSSYVGESELLTTKSDTDIKCDSSSTGSIANMITDDNNRHCIIADDDQNYSRKEEDNTCTTGFEYYIGPNQEEALVGTTSSAKYNMFVGSAKDAPVGNKCRTGVKHFYVMDVTTDLCTDVCSAVSNDTRSDAYLKCAENFCENDVDYNLGGNPYLRKQSCILHSCNYSYGVDPETKANNSNYRQSESSCDNSSLFKNGTEYKKYSVDQTTSCSMYGPNSNTIDNLQTELSICYGDTITDYDNNITNDKRFDERTYINIACQETDKVSSITDVSQKLFVPGEPIDYALKVRGTIQCIAFFDYEQWKIDYASIPRKDKIRKNRMKYLFDRFNNLVDSNYQTADSYTKFEALDYKGKNRYNWNMELTDYGTIDWSKYQFKTDNITASTTVSEYQLNNKINQTIENPLTVGAKEVTNTRNPIDLHSTGTSYIYTGLKNRKLYSVENYGDVVMDTSGNSTVQAYMITSGTDIAYQFSKYCVDNTAKTIKKAEGAKCSNGTDGENEYYVSFKAKDSKDIIDNSNHNFVTNVSIKSSLPIEQMYTDKTCTTSESRPPSVTYNNQDTCPYFVTRDNEKYKCELACSGSGALGKGNYQSSLDATMYTYEDGVRYNSASNKLHISSKYSNRVINSKSATLSISSGNTGTVEKYTIVGTFVGDDSKEYSCSKTCSVLKKVPYDPRCEINKISNDLYQIVPIGIYSRIGVTILRDTLSEEDIVDIMPDRYGRYLVEINNTSYETSLVLTGHISGSIGSNTCLYTDDDSIFGFNCPMRFKPGQYEEIKKYCDALFLKDVNNYDDPDDCVSKCIPCPDGVEPYEDTAVKIERNINIIKKDYCMKWAENKYKSYESCINTTYRLCVTGTPVTDAVTSKDKYLYRPVNRNNPFPSSAEASPGYARGDRPIGVNWQGYTNYIPETYINKPAPDFRITLDTATINLIRSKIDSLTSAGETNIYTKEKFMKEADPTKKYLSSFIHEDLDGRFCYLNGVKQSEECE